MESFNSSGIPGYSIIVKIFEILKCIAESDIFFFFLPHHFFTRNHKFYHKISNFHPIGS